jgi:hypothetical protein
MSSWLKNRTFKINLTRIYHWLKKKDKEKEARSVKPKAGSFER